MNDWNSRWLSVNLRAMRRRNQLRYEIASLRLAQAWSDMEKVQAELRVEEDAQADRDGRGPFIVKEWHRRWLERRRSGLQQRLRETEANVRAAEGAVVEFEKATSTLKNADGA